MVDSSLPIVLAHLADERNPAADAALVEALPSLEPFAQAAALDVLLRRANSAALAEVVGRFEQYDDTLRQLVVESVNDLSTGVRVAVSSPSLEIRLAAVETIVRGGASRLAYLLADALKSRCPQTRELAAAGLHRLTSDLLDGVASGASPEGLFELNAQLDALAEALATGVQRWEMHLRPKVLEASMWLAARTESAIIAKLGQSHANVVHMFIELIGGVPKPRMAGFLLRALAIPELSVIAAGAFSRASNIEFVKAVAEESWLLTDPRIARGWRRVRDLEWSKLLGSSDSWSGSSVAGLVGLQMAAGGSEANRVKALRGLVDLGREDVLNALVWRLLSDKSDTSCSLLSIVAARSEGSASKLAARELRRRRKELMTELPVWQEGPKSDDAVLALFDSYWRIFESLEEVERKSAREVLARGLDRISAALRARLTSLDSLDRTRALRIIADLGIESSVEESLYRLTSDSDAVVRSLVVSALTRLPGATSERLLRSAVNDSDPRVQANAIEALDRLNVDTRAACTEPKLNSAHSRVRAAAVRSLLRAESREAGDALLRMLEDEAVDHRLAGLWVVRQLNLCSLRPRVIKMTRKDRDERVRVKAAEVARSLGSTAKSTERCSESSGVGGRR